MALRLQPNREWFPYNEMIRPSTGGCKNNTMGPSQKLKCMHLSLLQKPGGGNASVECNAFIVILGNLYNTNQ